MQIEQQVPWGSPLGPFSGVPLCAGASPTGLGGGGGPKKTKSKPTAKSAPPKKKK